MSRIKNMQVRSRELGRLRAGYSVPNIDPKKRAVTKKSKTWILSSLQRDYVEAAAEIWGGEVEPWDAQGGGAKGQFRVITGTSEVDAVLMPGDPLSQLNELWSGGGNRLRCDGETEKNSGQPCVCAKNYGDDFHLQPVGTVCKITSRLSLVIPELPDLGVWMMVTHGYNAAIEMAATVDTLVAAAKMNGYNGPIPITMGIEQRTKVVAGLTKNFPVTVIKLRGANAGQALSGQARFQAIGGSQQAAPAPEPARAISSTDGRAEVPVDRILAAVRAAVDLPALKRIADRIKTDGIEDFEIDVAVEERMIALDPASNPLIDAGATEFCTRDGSPILDDGDRDAHRLCTDQSEEEIFDAELVDEPAPTGGYRDWARDLAAATTQADLTQLWKDLGMAGVQDIWRAQWKAQVDRVMPAQVDPDAEYQQIIAHAGQAGWNAPTLAKKFLDYCGTPLKGADGVTLAKFRAAVKAGEVS